MALINPSNGRSLREARSMSLKEAGDIANECARSAQHWASKSVNVRAECFDSLATVLRSSANDYAELMAVEMGKAVVEGRAEIEKCANCCEYYAANAQQMLNERPIASDATKSYVAFEPLGVILAIMPWNFPFWQVFRCAAPALMAGNAMILKHASNVPGCAEAIEDAFVKAGFPKKVLSNVYLNNEDTEALIDEPSVAAVTLTGSTRAGRAVAARAGAALKKCVLELGGSDPYVVLADADIELASKTCVKSRFINAGQSCIAAKRFIVEKRVLEEFQAQVLKHMQAVRVGSPLDEDTDIGPMARMDLRDELYSQVQDSIKKGAKLLLGGEVPDKPGAWFPPTVLGNVGTGMPAYHEELFGPVASIIEAQDQDDALRIANDTNYGLGAAIFSKDSEKAERLAKKSLQAGSCFVNTFVRSDSRLPFGGIKHSGHGRELSEFGIHEFTNIKTVFVA
ncbi:MAG: NAD-dependent succinate-semialdehyde dehydrogenase [Myxococcales bacterium]|nr:MAG: NAD-dependent succinate-semialdehyde dehydrogenase [Myxococcales bacterium]